MYGTLQTGVTEIRLHLPTGNELIGHVTYHPTDSSILLFDIIEDSVPTNTLENVDAIINPINVKVDSNLLSPTAGTRYLLTDDIGSAINSEGSEVWGNIVANANDIIEYVGDRWVVVFDSNNINYTQYATNNNTGIQYRWTGEEWVKSVEGLYRGGEWSIII